MSIITGNKQCLNKINSIYETWINYVSTVANSNDIHYNVNQLFWQLDHFIFNSYFYNLMNNKEYIIEFVDVDFKNNNYTINQLDIINKALNKNRNEKLKLLYPHHKEYISSIIINNRIFITYIKDELYKICNIDNNNNNNNDNNNSNDDDFQFSNGKIHSALSFNNDITKNIEINALDFKKENNIDILDISNIKDKRQVILQNKKPLYNSLTDIVLLNKLNSSLYRFNPVMLNLSLIIFHSMLHIKRDIDNNNGKNSYDALYPHDSHFLKEYLNFTPPALYGHSMIPPLTLK